MAVHTKVLIVAEGVIPKSESKAPVKSKIPEARDDETPVTRANKLIPSKTKLHFCPSLRPMIGSKADPKLLGLWKL